MKDENYKLAGASIEVTFHDGTTIDVHPLTDRDIEELNEWVRSEFISMVRRSLPKDAPTPEKQTELQTAYSQAAGIQWMSGVGASMMASPNGMARLMFVGCHKQIPFEELRELMFDPENLEKTRYTFERLNTSTDVEEKKGHPPKTRRRTRKKSTKR